MKKNITIIFSKDRAFQLDATLRSFYLQCNDFYSIDIKVLYTYSTDKYKEDYYNLMNEFNHFNNIDFIKENVFKNDLLNICKDYDSLLFLVDDNIFVKEFSLIEAFDKLIAVDDAIGVSLRLGKNTVYCYPLNKFQDIPKFVEDKPFLIYDWTKSELDFNYALEVSSSLYRVKDIYKFLEDLEYKNPNTLEEVLSQNRYIIANNKRKLICYETSRTFCAPFNKVQNLYENRDSGLTEYSAEELSNLFKEKYRFRIDKYINYIPNGCHEDTELFTSKLVDDFVSIIIPCYNQGHFISETIESVLNQNYKNWELIVVNDGSSDNTSEIINQFKKKNPEKHISLIEQTNQGLSAARNKGIKLSRGNYFIPIDSDDKLHEDFIVKTLKVIKSNTALGFVYSNIQHFGDRNDVWILPEFNKEKLIYEDNIVCVCSLVNKKAWFVAGGYDQNMKEGYEDWNFWISIVKNGWIGYRINEFLFYYRKRNNSMLSDSNKKREKLIATIVKNHKELYSNEIVNWANTILYVPTKINSKNIINETSVDENIKTNYKITFLINSILGVTGGNQTLLNICNNLVTKGFVVNIVTYTDKPNWLTLNVNHIKVPQDRPMAQYVPNSDVVVSTYFLNTHELNNINATEKIYYAQGDQYIFEEKEPLLNNENKKIYNDFKFISEKSYQYPNIKIIANSFNLKNQLKKKYKVDVFDVLPVGINSDVYKKIIIPKLDSKINILIVGPDVNGHPIESLEFKGILDIKKALLNIPDLYEKYKIVRISNSERFHFNEINCDFYITPDDLTKQRLYNEADILIYASHFDSCPLPPLEAMTTGTAVICTETDGAKEYCVHLYNSILVPIKEPQKIMDALILLTNDDNLRNKLIEGGLETSKNYTFEIMVNKLENIILSLLNTELKRSELCLRNALKYLNINDVEKALREINLYIENGNSPTEQLLNLKKKIEIKILS